MNTIPFDELKARLLANPEVKAEYDALEQEYAIARELIAARAHAGLSQAQLAAKMNTTQSTKQSPPSDANTGQASNQSTQRGRVLWLIQRLH